MPSAAARYLRVMQAGNGSVRQVPVAASQAIKKYDLLVLDSNGRATLAAAASNNVGAASATANQLCIAMQNSSSQAVDTLIEVMAVNDNTRLVMPLTTNGSAQAYADSLVGDSFEIRNVGGYFMVDVNANTNAKVQVVARDPDTPAADTWGRVIVAPIVGQWLK